MTTRAEGVADTRARILDAAFACFTERDFADVPLSDIAARAQTTVQTILRHYGTKDGVNDALVLREAGQVLAEREQIAVGDLDAAVGYLGTHYFTAGESILRLLAAEGRSELAAQAVATGRELHRAWVARTFAPWLDDLEAAARKRRLELLVAATDVFTWKILCRDGELDQEQYRLALGELLNAIKGAPR